MAGEKSYFPAINDILTPIDMARNYYAQQIQHEIARARAMNEIPLPSPTPIAPITTAAALPTPIPTTTPRSYFPAVNPAGNNLVYRPNVGPTPAPVSYLNPNLIAAKPNYSF